MLYTYKLNFYNNSFTVINRIRLASNISSINIIIAVFRYYNKYINFNNIAFNNNACNIFFFYKNNSANSLHNWFKGVNKLLPHKYNKYNKYIYIYLLKSNIIANNISAISNTSNLHIKYCENVTIINLNLRIKSVKLNFYRFMLIGFIPWYSPTYSLFFHVNTIIVPYFFTIYPYYNGFLFKTKLI